MEKDFDISRVKIMLYMALQGVAGLLVLSPLFVLIVALAMRPTQAVPFPWLFGVPLLLVLCYVCCTPIMVYALRYRIDTKALRIDKGVLFKSRKSIPLDKITDLELVQGPLLRVLNMWTIKVQTASTGSQMPEATLVGTIDPERVRDEILTARDEHIKLRCQKQQRGGFTLLEVLLTAAILLIGLTAIFQTTRSAQQRMSAARELTEAQNACQSVLNELLAQASPIQPDSGKTIEHLPNWRIRVDIYPASQPSLYVLHLSAQQFSPTDNTSLGTQYQLLRWVPAERVRLPEQQSEMFGGSEFENLFQ